MPITSIAYGWLMLAGIFVSSALWWRLARQVAAGILPAVEPWRPARRNGRADVEGASNSSITLNCWTDFSGR